MNVREFGKLQDGRSAGLYILKNTCGMEAAVTDYGATLVSLIVPNDTGKLVDVVLGHDSAQEYATGHGYLGATVGRYANRIGGAAFELDGKRYELEKNDGPNCLHGGKDAYGTRLWQTRIPFTNISSKDVAAKANAIESIGDGGQGYVQEDVNGDSVTFCLDSPDGDQGFPGDLHIEVTYTLNNEGELHIDYKAETDADTVLNLTNHSYFNLNGHDSGSILDQLCQINASLTTPNDSNILTTGEIKEVAGTVMDFRIAKPLGVHIDKEDEQLINCGGYDHNFILDGEGYREVASLYSDKSGIRMKVLTDLPGMQLYTGNGLNDEPGKGGCVYANRTGVCFETQFWPDSINKENFPGGILRAGEVFRSRTTYRFSR